LYFGQLDHRTQRLERDLLRVCNAPIGEARSRRRSCSSHGFWKVCWKAFDLLGHWLKKFGSGHRVDGDDRISNFAKHFATAPEKAVRVTFE
jgi:hypothetical protein